jgi:stress response protein YsnF
MPLDIETALDWRGRTVVDRDGDKIGKFDELYLDDSDNPAWAAVTTGLFGMRQTFVPLSEARPDGDVLKVPFAKDLVKDAPSVDPDAQLSPEDEDVLYRHYGVRGGRSGGDDAAARETAVDDDAPVERTVPDDAAVAEGTPDEEPVREEASATAAPASAGTSGEGAEMIRSEEEVSVGKRRRVSGKARLKKYVVTEHVQKVVPVQREEVRVEFEPAEGEEASAPDSTGEVAEPGPDDVPARER